MSNLRDLPLLRSLMAMAHALLTSPFLHIEPYVTRPPRLHHRSRAFVTLHSAPHVGCGGASLVCSARACVQLHQLMPPILTCLLGKRVCSLPTDDHWSLRDTAASLVALVCRK